MVETRDFICTTRIISRKNRPTPGMAGHGVAAEIAARCARYMIAWVSVIGSSFRKKSYHRQESWSSDWFNLDSHRSRPPYKLYMAKQPFMMTL
jgi:hypothetical protein